MKQKTAIFILCALALIASWGCSSRQKCWVAVTVVNGTEKRLFGVSVDCGRGPAQFGLIYPKGSVGRQMSAFVGAPATFRFRFEGEKTEIVGTNILSRGIIPEERIEVVITNRTFHVVTTQRR